MDSTPFLPPSPTSPTSPTKPTPTTTNIHPSLPTRRSPALAAKLAHLRLPLAPLVRLTTGETHPSFPATLLNFWLLTTEQLDELAHFYHQRTPCEWTRCYPCPVVWDRRAAIEVKRRRLGRFIGLRGCESAGLESGAGEGVRESEREMERRVEREIERRRARDRDEEDARRKGRWY